MEIFVKQKDFLKKLPTSPGVYRFYAINSSEGDANELLYIGKAINLAKRVKSYFQRSHELSPRIGLMVKKIARIEITVTANESTALVLENNLIKSLKPKYNIIFRDDKTYPFIRMTKHKFPKIESYRGQTNNTGHLFGPYPNAYAVKKNIDIVSKLFKLRTCSDSFFNNRSRPCMLYEIKRCTAPCVGYVSDNEYNKQVKQAIEFLDGNYTDIITELTSDMYQASKELEFEVAANIRDKISTLMQLGQNQVLNAYGKLVNADLVLADISSGFVFIYLVIIRNGMHIGDNNFVIEHFDNSLEDVLIIFLQQYYLSDRGIAEIYLPQFVLSKFNQIFYEAFKIVIKSKLNNGLNELYRTGQLNLQKIIEMKHEDKNLTIAADILANKLGILEVKRIECIDISHNHGDNAIASLVVYTNGKIDHTEYRKYNLATEIAGNDLLGLKTVLIRRLNDKLKVIPDVILVDGGELQLEVVKKLLGSLGLYGKIRVVAIFKGARRNPVLDKVLLDDGRILVMSEEKILFRLLQKLRDEAHRFAITGHRKKQVKKMTNSALMDIPNIGRQKRRALITYFGSIKNIASASINDLYKVPGIGENLAKQIYTYFH